jgi:rhodanese-related sulfurtransferase
METSKANLQLLDFRDLEEVHEKRIPHSISMPFDELEKRIRELDKDKEMAVHCLSGLHSYKACRKLKHADFDKIKNVDGGLLSWIHDTEAGEKKE